MPLIELKNIIKSYAEPEQQTPVPVLRGISLSIKAGESVAIVGPSGCGKSTLLNILGTLDEPDEGEAWLEGESLKGASAQRLSELRSQKIGFIFQLHHLLPQCTVLENVLIPTLAIKGGPDREARAKELLKIVGLEHRTNWRPAQLSGGERQRVAVVRALINEPRLILADEPTGALDETNAAALTDLLIDLQKKTGVTLVLVTHHRAQAERMGRLLQIHEGRIVG
ncbi:MAG: transporter related [Verrucomicrobiaceae bacterium]|nr:transporter related [Verrucomicrobiaceae bacterium]